jgi:type I restriction enzyme, S subunit
MQEFHDNPMQETKIGQLPADWVVYRVGDLGEIVTGSTPSTTRPQYYGGSYKFISPGDLGKDRCVTHTSKSLSEAGLAVSRVLPPSTVLVVCIGATIGKTGITGDEKSATNQQINAVIPNGKVLPDFLYYALTYRASALPSLAGRAAVPIVNKSNFADFLVPVAPSPEQRAIARVLRTVQEAKRATEKVIAATRQLKQSLMRHLFTYGPVPIDQAGRVELKETEVGTIPKHWDMVMLGNVARIGNGSTPKRTNNAYWLGGTIPWLTSGKVYERIIRHADEFVTEQARMECHLPMVKRNSVVVAITGQGKTLGHAALVSFDTCVSQHLAYVQFGTNGVVPEYVRSFLQSRYAHFRQVSSGGGSTKGALTCGFLKTYPLPVPPFEEQQRIAQALDAVETKKEAEQARQAALDALFQTLLHHLMTGRVRVGRT